MDTSHEIRELLREIRDLQRQHLERYQEFLAEYQQFLNRTSGEMDRALARDKAKSRAYYVVVAVAFVVMTLAIVLSFLRD